MSTTPLRHLAGAAPAERLDDRLCGAIARPALRFTPYAWARLLFLRDAGPTEVGGFGISSPGDHLLIEDVRLVRQRCTRVPLSSLTRPWPTSSMSRWTWAVARRVRESLGAYPSGRLRNAVRRSGSSMKGACRARTTRSSSV